MRVKVLFLQELYEAAGTHMLVLELPDNARVRDLLDRLPEPVRRAALDHEGRPKPLTTILVNGRRIDFLEGLDTRLKDGDTVHIAPRPLFVV